MKNTFFAVVLLIISLPTSSGSEVVIEFSGREPGIQIRICQNGKAETRYGKSGKWTTLAHTAKFPEEQFQSLLDATRQMIWKFPTCKYKPLSIEDKSWYTISASQAGRTDEVTFERLDAEDVDLIRCADSVLSILDKYYSGIGIQNTSALTVDAMTLPQTGKRRAILASGDQRREIRNGLSLGTITSTEGVNYIEVERLDITPHELVHVSANGGLFHTRLARPTNIDLGKGFIGEQASEKCFRAVINLVNNVGIPRTSELVGKSTFAFSISLGHRKVRIESGGIDTINDGIVEELNGMFTLFTKNLRNSSGWQINQGLEKGRRPNNENLDTIKEDKRK